MQNTFLQADMLTCSERNIMNIRIMLVCILVELALEAHKDWTAWDRNKNKIFPSSMLKLLHEMMKVSMIRCN